MIIWLESLGCSRNQVDSEIMSGRLVDAGHKIGDGPSKADIIIVNTCGFISEAADEAVDTILEMAEYKLSGSCRRLIVTGCLPERFKEDDLASSLPEVDVFLGTGAVDFIVEAVQGRISDIYGSIGDIGAYSGIGSSGSIGGDSDDASTCAGIISCFPDPCKREFPSPDSPRKLTLDYSAYIKISEGCSRKCTYCIIPKLRGIQRSRPVDDIISETKKFILQGVKEIIFTGENTTDYGEDFDEELAREPLCDTQRKLPGKTLCKPYEIEHDKIDLTFLLKRLSVELDKKIPAASLLTSGSGENKISHGIWLRLLYTHPSSLSHGIVKCISEMKIFCSYYDVPVQHASSKILKKMGRPYTMEDLYSLFKFIRKTDPDAVLRTTLITGFPGETNADFQILLNFIKDIEFDHLGVFTYSDSQDLKSHNFKNHVPKELALKRQDILMAEQVKISEKINEKHLGRVYQVLVEENSEEGLYLGRTAFQAPEVDGITFIYGSGLEIGTFVDVRITETFEYDLAGEIEML